MVYRGVPFAAPPVGGLRWRPPGPAAAWEGVRDATAAAPACMQNPIPAAVRTFYDAGVDRMDEDCLYLNVWTAAGPDDRAPVMVWIHGGGLAIGNGADITYDGTRLAQRGVVLVTVNYRLGAFGYLAHPRLSAESEHGASGNYGTLDQIAALGWIQRNIAAFGGDPSRVAIFGESAGSWSVNQLMATPLARGLFHAAIGESGGGFGSRGGAQPRAEIESAGERFVEALLGEGAAPTPEAMRAASADAVQAVAPELVRSTATVDGWVFPDTVYNIFAAGRQARRAGHRRLERRRDDHPRRRGGGGYPGAVPRDNSERVRRARGRIPRDLPGRHRRGGAAGPGGGRHRRHLRVGDADLGSHDGDGLVAGVSLLLQSGAAGPRRRPLRGVPHGGDPLRVRQLRGQPPPLANRDYSDTDRRLSDILASYWVNMAATGNPNGEGLPEWPAYDPEADAALRIGDTITVERGIRKDRLDFFDRYYVAQREGSD